ncbi:hypothetical protein H5410_017537 [Solanum commersonii]|uniref:Uncharacterized protein n=1 Tax=Solanum commersonii TaxID=4109 RepID=A0A9J5ZZK2_SOLCO|nr:hypothetical protein H5410_017537 [Solanum commersonii]
MDSQNGVEVKTRCKNFHSGKCQEPKDTPLRNVDFVIGAPLCGIRCTIIKQAANDNIAISYSPCKFAVSATSLACSSHTSLMIESRCLCIFDISSKWHSVDDPLRHDPFYDVKSN